MSTRGWKTGTKKNYDAFHQERTPCSEGKLHPDETLMIIVGTYRAVVS